MRASVAVVGEVALGQPGQRVLGGRAGQRHGFPRESLERVVVEVARGGECRTQSVSSRNERSNSERMFACLLDEVDFVGAHARQRGLALRKHHVCRGRPGACHGSEHALDRLRRGYRHANSASKLRLTPRCPPR